MEESQRAIKEKLDQLELEQEIRDMKAADLEAFQIRRHDKIVDNDRKVKKQYAEARKVKPMYLKKQEEY
jgi:hypothetical protein